MKAPIRARMAPFHRVAVACRSSRCCPTRSRSPHLPGRSLPGLSATAPGRTGTWCEPGRRAQRIDGCADRLGVVLAERLLCRGHARGRGSGELAERGLRLGLPGGGLVPLAARPLGFGVRVLGPGPQVVPGGFQRGRAGFERGSQVVPLPGGVGADLRDLALRSGPGPLELGAG